MKTYYWKDHSVKANTVASAAKKFYRLETGSIPQKIIKCVQYTSNKFVYECVIMGKGGKKRITVKEGEERKSW